MPRGKCDGIHSDCMECRNLREHRKMVVRLIFGGFVLGGLIGLLHRIATQ